MPFRLSENAFAGRTVVLIGGGSGIGLATARLVSAAGGRVVLGGRTASTLRGAAAQLADATWAVVDTSDPSSIDDFFAGIDVVHGLFTTAASYVTGPLADLSVAEAATAFDSKFWGQYLVVKAALPRLASDASIVLMSGAAGARPAGPAPAYSAANAAIEGLARGLAVELSPVRVNAIAPGTVDGALWARRDAAVREEAFAFYRAATLRGQLCTEDDIAESVGYLLLNAATTGSTLFPDGGYTFH